MLRTFKKARFVLIELLWLLANLSLVKSVAVWFKKSGVPNPDNVNGDTGEPVDWDHPTGEIPLPEPVDIEGDYTPEPADVIRDTAEMDSLVEVVLQNFNEDFKEETSS